MDFNQEADIFRNIIICSYANCRKLTAKFPNKKVMPDAHCPDTWFYYINRDGKVRNYDTLTGMLYDQCIGDFNSVMMLTKYSVKL